VTAQGAREQRQGIGAMSTRTAAWLAWAVCAISLAVTALCFLLIALNLSLDSPAYFFWPDLTVLALGYSVIGAISPRAFPTIPSAGSAAL
jgi:hypothetical protein